LSRTGILAHQLKAARALARMDQQELADQSGVSVPTIKRMEAGDGPIRGTYENVAAVVAVLESAGVEFTNGDKPGVQLARQPASASKPAASKAKATAAKPRPSKK
jgi:transcriptional regulator with XRE-family HTH domain